MSKQARTDCHCPSRLIPSDYRRILSFAFAGGGQFPNNLPLNVDRLIELRRTQRFFRQGEGTGQCHVCGAHFRFGDVFEHIPTGEHIVVGWECGEQIDALCDRSEFDRAYAGAKEQALAAMKREQKVAQRAEFLAANEGLETALAGDHRILRDLAEKVQKWGSLTEGQVRLALKIAAELNAPAKPKAEVPNDGQRRTVTGRVVSLKVVDSNYGSTEKMLVEVETPAGAFRVFGKVPAAIAPKRDDVVTFSAVLERSEKDPSFGFFSRPTKAEIAAQAPVQP